MSTVSPRSQDMPTGPHSYGITAPWHNAWTRLEPHGFRSRVCACTLNTDHWEEPAQ